MFSHECRQDGVLDTRFPRSFQALFPQNPVTPGEPNAYAGDVGSVSPRRGKGKRGPSQERNGIMACARCGGLLVQEPVYDREGSSQLVLMNRCLQCGNIEDPVSVRNREQITQPSSQKGKARRDPEHPFPPIQLAKG